MDPDSLSSKGALDPEFCYPVGSGSESGAPLLSSRRVPKVTSWETPRSATAAYSNIP